ncbi:IclR family transcriptional regulator [Nocardia tengchongensis]|uniref:IclR family transcriptional regulator n=1 Tax=Nocardia tengchongensis TaxID=2055889 RepID=A0ABX8CWR7_9NOCA|nr:IclR family transcriptional regulator [Nocardia tengchongensis]
MIERMSLILDTFPYRTSRLTLDDVARATRLPRSTAHRIIEQMIRVRWLDRTSSGYSLGPRALQVGSNDDANALRSAAAPLLHALMLRTGMTVHLATLDRGQVCFLDKMGGHSATSVPSRVGATAPAHATALGKAMLASLTPEEVDRRVAGAMTRSTASTITDINLLHKQLSAIRDRNGIAFERGECFDDIACTAVAIRTPLDSTIGAISVTGKSDAQLKRVAPLVLDAARQVTAAIFPQP